MVCSFLGGLNARLSVVLVHCVGQKGFHETPGCRKPMDVFMQQGGLPGDVLAFGLAKKPFRDY